MEDVSRSRATTLESILSAISSHLDTSEVADVRLFIVGGEYGLAADTIFSAIYEDHIPLDDTLIDQLSTIEDLYNTFDDLDPEIAGNVLRHDQRPMPFGM